MGSLRVFTIGPTLLLVKVSLVVELVHLVMGINEALQPNGSKAMALSTALFMLGWTLLTSSVGIHHMRDLLRIGSQA